MSGYLRFNCAKRTLEGEQLISAKQLVLNSFLLARRLVASEWKVRSVAWTGWGQHFGNRPGNCLAFQILGRKGQERAQTEQALEKKNFWSLQAVWENASRQNVVKIALIVGFQKNQVLKKICGMCVSVCPVLVSFTCKRSPPTLFPGFPISSKVPDLIMATDLLWQLYRPR